MRNFTAREQVLLDFAFLSEGETSNGNVCPKCNGGMSKDKSLSVSRRDGALLWICYRDSCDFYGRESGGGRVPRTAPVSARGATGRAIARQAEPIAADVQALLLSKYSIGRELTARAGFGWDSESSRLVMPVRDAQGQELGVILRSLSGAKPKVISHTEQGAMAWYTNPTTPGVIIVEDQLSALRASDFLTSVALLGTNLSEERITVIKKANLGPVYLALDNDAIASAVKYVVKYRSLLSMQLVRLDKDIKEMTHEEASALFSTISK